VGGERQLEYLFFGPRVWLRGRFYCLFARI
jgi:hypothetical protein